MGLKVRVASKKDIAKITSFIDNHWKKGHALVKSEELFNWQHVDNDIVNYIISENEKAETIDALFGFIPISKFDTNLESKDYFGAMWKSVNNELPSLGIFLIKFFLKKYNPNYIGFIGISKDAENIYRRMGLKIKKLNHYVFINKRAKEFKIVESKIENSNYSIKDDQVLLKEIYELSKIDLLHNYRPKKTIEYVINRFQNHTHYKYRFIGIYKGKKLISILIIRKQEVDTSSCINIIDIFGKIEEIPNIQSELSEFLISENSEYIDCLNYGINDDVFKKIGFNKVDINNQTVPIYFEPFERKNVEIKFSYISNYNDFIIFKGDGDQDRPNIIL